MNVISKHRLLIYRAELTRWQIADLAELAQWYEEKNWSLTSNGRVCVWAIQFSQDT